MSTIARIFAAKRARETETLNTKLLAACQRSAYLLAEMPRSEQSPQILALRAQLVEAIKEAAPEYYGLSKP